MSAGVYAVALIAMFAIGALLRASHQASSPFSLENFVFMIMGLLGALTLGWQALHLWLKFR